MCLKFRPIIDQTNTYTYHATKAISNYLKLLRSNEYTTKDTQVLVAEIKPLPPLNDDEEDVSYDVQSLFANILVEETINYIIDQVYNKGRLTPICKKLIFKRLLKK